MSIPRRLLSFWRNRAGVSAVEFALLLPVLILLIMGAAETTNIVIAQRKVLASAQTICDLISQETDVTSASLDDLIAAGMMVIRPLDTNVFAVGVASVRFDEDANASVDWIHSLNSGAVANALAIAAPLAQADTSVIIVFASYDYAPITGGLVMNGQLLSDISVTRPRLVPYIEKS